MQGARPTSELDAAAELLAETFHDDPAYSLLAEDDDRPAALLALWTFLVHAQPGQTVTHRTADGLMGVVWHGEPQPPSWSRWLWAGGATLPPRMGLRSHRILTQLDRRLAPLFTSSALPEGVVWLRAIGVRRGCRRRGVGSELLVRGLAGAAGRPWALLTSRPELHGWYGRYGFVVVADRQVAEGVTSSLLVRAARPGWPA